MTSRAKSRLEPLLNKELYSTVRSKYKETFRESERTALFNAYVQVKGTARAWPQFEAELRTLALDLVHAIAAKPASEAKLRDAYGALHEYADLLSQLLDNSGNLVYSQLRWQAHKKTSLIKNLQQLAAAAEAVAKSELPPHAKGRSRNYPLTLAVNRFGRLLRKYGIPLTNSRDLDQFTPAERMLEAMLSFAKLPQMPRGNAKYLIRQALEQQRHGYALLLEKFDYIE